MQFIMKICFSSSEFSNISKLKKFTHFECVMIKRPWFYFTHDKDSEGQRRTVITRKIKSTQ